MPYKSKKQEAFFNANRDKLEAQGVDVDEWNNASRGLKLPVRVPKTKPGNINSQNTWHSVFLARSTLTLLVARVGADDANHAPAFHHFAVFAQFFNRSSYLHFQILFA